MCCLQALLLLQVTEVCGAAGDQHVPNVHCGRFCVAVVRARGYSEFAYGHLGAPYCDLPAAPLSAATPKICKLHLLRRCVLSWVCTPLQPEKASVMGSFMMHKRTWLRRNNPYCRADRDQHVLHDCTEAVDQPAGAHASVLLAQLCAAALDPLSSPAASILVRAGGVPSVGAAGGGGLPILALLFQHRHAVCQHGPASRQAASSGFAGEGA